MKTAWFVLLALPLAAQTPAAPQEPAPAKTETPGDRGTQNSTIATAATSDTSTGSVEASAVDKVSTGGSTCSRYFPTVGQTLRVPCDN